MNSYLLVAGALSILTGLAHSWLGERLILIRLFRREDLPPVLGSALFTKRVLRFAWHITTILLCGIGAIIIYLATRQSATEGSTVLVVLSSTFLACSIVTGAFSRGKHFSWVVFLAIAALLWFSAR